MLLFAIMLRFFGVERDDVATVGEAYEAEVWENDRLVPPPPVEDICLLADGDGVGEPFRGILKAAQDVGLYARPYKYSIMYTPPNNRNRMLFTAWAQAKNGGLARVFQIVANQEPENEP